MKKNLRLLLMGLFVLFAGQTFAEEVTINFDDDYATLFPTITGVSSNDSNEGDFTGPTTSEAVQGVTVTVTPAEDAKTPSRIWSGSPRLRMYSGTFTVNGTDITKIVINAPSKFNMTANTGTLDGKTWTGDKTSEVVFNVGGNTQIKSIVVTLGEGGDTPGPVDPVETTKVGSIADLVTMDDTENVELTLTNAKVIFADGNSIYVRENGAAICFYGIDAVKNLFKDNALVSGTIIVDYLKYQGLMPELKSNAYTSSTALTVTESEEAAEPVETTLAKVANGDHTNDLVTLTAKLVREYAVKEDGTTSTSATYYLEDGDVKLVAVNNSKNLNKLAEDGVETVIVTGVVNVAKNAYQIKLTKNAVDPNDPGDNPGPGPQPGELTGNGSLDNPYTATDAISVASQLEKDAVTAENYYIKGKIASIKYEFSAQYGTATFYISDDGTATNTFQVYSTYYLGNRAWVEGDTQIKTGDEVIIYGQLTNYKGTTPETVDKKSYIYSLNGVTDGGQVTPVETTKVASIEALLAMESPSTNVELTLTNAKVVFNDGNSIYVRENGSAICFYGINALKELFKNNAIINGTIIVDYEVYKLLPEVKSNAQTNTDNLTVTESEEEAVPVQTTLTAVDEGENVCDLVTLTAKLVRVVTESKDENGDPKLDKNGNPITTTEYFLEDDEARVKVANNGKNLGKLADDGVETIIVTGVVNTYNNAYQIKLTKNAVDPNASETIKGDVNGDGSVNVADISAIIDVMAGTGEYNDADVNGDGSVNVADISSVIDIMAE